MAADALNIVDPAVPGPSATAGDVPERVRRRYLTDAQNGPGLGFYVDAAVKVAAFRDHGGRLSTDRNDPSVIRDLVAVARHRGWSAIAVRGETAFRRETWLTARQAGLEVRGYTPSERDLQDLARRLERGPPDRASPAKPAGLSPEAAGPRARLKVVESVVRNRIVEPAAQARILAAARSRMADWLERGARFDVPRRLEPQRRQPDRDR